MFFKRKRDQLCIDIGSSGWRMLRRGKDAPLLTCGVWPENVLGGTFSKPLVDFSRLKELLAAVVGDQPADVFLLCPDQLVKLMYLTLPRDAASRNDREYVRFRLRKQLDSSIPRDVHIDFVVHSLAVETDSDPDGTAEVTPGHGFDVNQLHCNVLIARNDLVSGLKQAVCGKQHRFAGLSSTAAATLPVLIGEGRDETAALINLGHEVTTVTIVSGGIMIYQRVIETAGRHLIEHMARIRSLSMDAAVTAFRGLTLPRGDNGLQKALEDWSDVRVLFSQLVDEIQLTFKFYLETWRRGPVTRIALTGGMASLDGLDRFLGGVFQAQCHRLTDRQGEIQFSPADVMLADFLKEAE